MKNPFNKNSIKAAFGAFVTTAAAAGIIATVSIPGLAAAGMIGIGVATAIGATALTAVGVTGAYALFGRRSGGAEGFSALTKGLVPMAIAGVTGFVVGANLGYTKSVDFFTKPDNSSKQAFNDNAPVIQQKNTAIYPGASFKRGLV